MSSGDRDGGQCLLEAIEGSYVTALLLGLERNDLLERLDEPCSAAELAAETDGISADSIAAALAFLAKTTAFLDEAEPGRFALSGTRAAEVVFQIGKFGAGYGRPVAYLGAEGPDGRARAPAFERAASFHSPLIPDLVRERGARSVLDLGCGPASVLLQLARSDPDLRGIGVDASRAACRRARRRIRKAGLERRIKILRADAGDLRGALRAKERKGVDVLYGRSFLNEFFGGGTRDAVRVVRRLRKLFPGRRAWFIDSYGRLARSDSTPATDRLALLQDLVQVLSGQGVPPCDADGWAAVYSEGGSRLRDVREFEGDGIRWFLHTVDL